jgi:hypothetical protein
MVVSDGLGPSGDFTPEGLPSDRNQKSRIKTPLNSLRISRHCIPFIVLVNKLETLIKAKKSL